VRLPEKKRSHARLSIAPLRGYSALFFVGQGAVKRTVAVERTLQQMPKPLERLVSNGRQGRLRLSVILSLEKQIPSPQ